MLKKHRKIRRIFNAAILPTTVILGSLGMTGVLIIGADIIGAMWMTIIFLLAMWLTLFTFKYFS